MPITKYSASMQNSAIALPSATLKSRLAAMIYELLLVTAVLFLAAFVFIPLAGDMGAAWKRHAFQIYLLAVLFAYFSIFWMRSGQTLAMKTWRIRLVDRDGKLIGLKQALLRFVLAFLGLGLFGLSIVWAGFDRDRQFLHDRLAGTRLVRVTP
jgi:uncharacterized RDD family membrane protein YckC